MKNKILLIYPELGFAGSFVTMAPLSLLYAAAKLVDLPGLTVEILDCRVSPHWRQELAAKVQTGDLLLVGVTTMSGLQVHSGAEVTGLVKQTGDIPVIWGGAHPTILPAETLDVPGVDYCQRGYGSRALRDLVLHLQGGGPPLDEIKGLCFHGPQGKVIGEIEDRFEDVPHHQIPYQLIDPFVERYFARQQERVFPLYTVFGCPYQCAFCISPLWYRHLKDKWCTFEPDTVVDHMQFLIARYGIQVFYMIDDDTFVNLEHFRGMAALMQQRGIKVKLGIRGLRVNEALKMTDQDFALLQQVGGRTVHIGVESGSQRMLDLMGKRITVEQSLEMNRRLARYPELLPMYNILVGLPSETIEDLKQTGRFMLRMARENPHAIFIAPGRFVPYPGTKLCDLAVQYGFKVPQTLEQWRDMDQETNIYQPWYTPQYNRYIDMLRVASYALSNWEAFLVGYPRWLRLFFKAAKLAYRPIAEARIRLGWAGCLVESSLMKFFYRKLGNLNI